MGSTGGRDLEARLFDGVNGRGSGSVAWRGGAQVRAVVPCPLPADRVAWWRERMTHFPEKRAVLLPLLHETELRRGRLPLDPAGDLADASRRFAAASETLEQLDTVRDRVAGIRKLADEAGRRERDLRRAGERLSDKVRPGLYDDFAALIAVDARLAEDEDSLQQEIGQYESKIRELQGELDDAEERGIGVAATASALTVLTATAGQLPVWHTDRTNLEAERATIAESLAELDERARRLAGLAEKVAEAEEADQRASEDSEAATTTVTDCSSRRL